MDRKMPEAKDLSENLLEKLGDLVPKEQEKALRKKAEKVAQESLKGFEQLKEDVNKIAVMGQKLADEALKSMEDALADIQTNIQQMDERRRIQELQAKLAHVLEKLSESNAGEQLRTDLEKKTQAIIEAIQNCGEQLRKEIIDQVEDLLQSISHAEDKDITELKEAIAQAVEAAQPNTKQVK